MIKEFGHGIFYLDLRRMYDFQPGDILAYGTFLSCGGKGHRTDTIVGRTEKQNGDTIVYTIQRGITTTLLVTENTVGQLTQDNYYYTTETVDPLTSHSIEQGDYVTVTSLFADSINVVLSGFESGYTNAYSKGLGLTYSFNSEYEGICGNNTVSWTKLQCWKTSQRENSNFEGCVQTLLGVENQYITPRTPKIYPNPMQNALSIELPEAAGGGMSLDVYDLLGNKCMSQNFASTLASVDVQTLPKGMYTITIRTANGAVYNEKIVKE
jgi:hypothetical protein